ncbi:hypothetical protein BJX76DRAFT_37235 [Aspergillus varians]
MMDQCNQGELEAKFTLLRLRFHMLRLKYDHYQPSDIRSGRKSIIKKLINEFPSLELPDYLLTLERLAYMHQESRYLEDHADEFRQLARKVPSQYESLTVTWFARSVADRVSRKILKGILASFACSGMDCDLDDIIQIATAVDEADLGDLEAKDATEESASEIKVLTDVIAVQKMVIETLAERLSQLQARVSDSSTDSVKRLGIQQPNQSSSEPQVPSCQTQ